MLPATRQEKNDEILWPEKPGHGNVNMAVGSFNDRNYTVRIFDVDVEKTLR